MPYSIGWPLKRIAPRLAAMMAVLAAVLGVAAGPAAAAGAVAGPLGGPPGGPPAGPGGPAPCTPSALTQPFTALGDTNLYALPGGESYDNVDGAGWTLTGGANLVTTQLADGTTGRVLDLPSGATAVSPLMCINSTYPSARAMIQKVTGAGGVSFAISYPDLPGQSAFADAGEVQGQGGGWSLSNPVAITSGALIGWQPVQFEFSVSGQQNEYQLYNFAVDPYSR